MSEREQRRLTTILAADVAGFSRLTGADEEGTLRRLRALRAELIDPVIATFRGRIFKTTGDGLLIEFASVVEAARCALDVQRAMDRYNADFVPAKRIEFRVGIHLGDVLVEADGDLVGDGVNIAARLEGIADSGGICLSNAAYEQVRDKIDAAFADLGEQSLKNIARPVRVYAIENSPPHSSSPSRAVGAGPSLSPLKGGEGNLGPPRLSIVVLPFANIGGDPEQDYFVDGVTESLTTDLSRISGSFVIARNTAFTYKGKPADVKQIGGDLNVRYVLEGSVQKGGNRLRVNVQLIDAETGNHLWAERFDKPVADLFDMQDEIVARLANQLNAQLIAAEARRAERAPNPDSMDFYFQGVGWLNKGTTAENFDHARRYFERALAGDPENVNALIGQARVDAELTAALLAPDRDARLKSAEAALNVVLSRAPASADAHFWLGLVLTRTNRAVQGIAQFERALAIDPNFARAHGATGSAKVFIGRADEAEAHVHDALRLSPRDVSAHIWMHIAGTANAYLGRDEESVAWLRRAIETNRNFPLMHFYLASGLAHLGRLGEADAVARAGLALDPTFTVRRARANASSDNPTYLAQRERVIDGMRLAGVPEG